MSNYCTTSTINNFCRYSYKICMLGNWNAVSKGLHFRGSIEKSPIVVFYATKRKNLHKM